MEDDSIEARKKRKEAWRIKDALCKNGCGRNKANGSSRCRECSEEFKNKKNSEKS